MVTRSNLAGTPRYCPQYTTPNEMHACCQIHGTGVLQRRALYGKDRHLLFRNDHVGNFHEDPPMGREEFQRSEGSGKCRNRKTDNPTRHADRAGKADPRMLVAHARRQVPPFADSSMLNCICQATRRGGAVSIDHDGCTPSSLCRRGLQRRGMLRKACLQNEIENQPQLSSTQYPFQSKIKIKSFQFKKRRRKETKVLDKEYTYFKADI